MAYKFAVNTVPKTPPIAFYTLISTLMSAGWLKLMDSDGTTYSSSGTQVTSGNVGTNGLDNSKAWVRLQAPAVNGGAVVNQTRELIIQRGTASNRDWKIKYSASAGFTDGSPAATVTPFASDEVYMNGGGTDASPTFSTGMFFDFTEGVNPCRWHVACGGANEYYSFVAWLMRTGTTILGNSIALDVMTPGSYPSQDIDPAVMYSSSIASSFGTEVITNTFPTVQVTNPALARAWLGPVSSVRDGASLTGSNVNVRISSYAAIGLVTDTTSYGTNPWNQSEDLLPCLWGAGDAVNGTNGSNPKGIKGFSTLFLQGLVGHKNMTICDSVLTGSMDRIYVGTLWFPWSGDRALI